jgi:hypothetical protein
MPFDTRMIKQTSAQNGHIPINFGMTTARLSFENKGIFRYEAMDPLRTIHKANYRVKLETLINEHITPEKFAERCNEYKERYNIPIVKSGRGGLLHNAFFDTLGLFELVNKYRNLILRLR